MRAPRASPNLIVFAVKSLWILRIFLPFLASPVFVQCAQFWWHQLLSWKWNHSYSMCVESQHCVQWLFNGLPLIDCNVFELGTCTVAFISGSLMTEYALRTHVPKGYFSKFTSAHIRHGNCQILYTSKIPIYFHFTQENRVNRAIFANMR